MAAPQTYANHARFFPMFHFFVAPILAVNVIVAGRALFRDPALGSAWFLVVALAFLMTAFTARLMALTAQDRVIRLEERLRLERILPEDLKAVGQSLQPRQFVALRFASDAEAPALVRRIAGGELGTEKQIKAAITDWKADTLRV